MTDDSDKISGGRLMDVLYFRRIFHSQTQFRSINIFLILRLRTLTLRKPTKLQGAPEDAFIEKMAAFNNMFLRG